MLKGGRATETSNIESVPEDSQPSQKFEPAQTETSPILQKKGLTTRKPPARVTLFAVLVIILIAGLIWFASRAGRKGVPVTPTPIPIATPQSTPPSESTSTPIPTPTPTPASNESASPKNAKDYLDSGIAYYYKNDYDKAINDYSEAIKLDRNYDEAYLNRGIAYCAKKDYDEAIRNYNEAIKLDRNYDEAYLNRGIAYYAKNDYDKAISDYSEAIKLRPDFGVAYYDRGKAYKARGRTYRTHDVLKNDYDLAQVDFDKARQLGVNGPE